jgi:16S rRNA processing protein RimM
MPDSERAPLRDILYIGRIAGAWGLKGELRIVSLSDDPHRFLDLGACFLVSPDEQIRLPARATGARLQNDQVLLRLEGVEDRTQAEQLKGQLVGVSRTEAVALPPDTWFICDLIGCAVYDEKHGFLGHLTDVQTTAAHDVYTAHSSGEKDLLFPALKSILRKVDLTARRMDVTLPDGLFEIYRGQS